MCVILFIKLIFITINPKLSIKMLSINKLDIFTVDPVQLQIDKRKTKTFFGSFLTFLLISITLTLFILLYTRNESKAPIISQEVLTTSNLKKSVQSKIEWNSDIVDIDSIQPFFLINQSIENNLYFLRC